MIRATLVFLHSSASLASAFLSSEQVCWIPTVTTLLSVYLESAQTTSAALSSRPISRSEATAMQATHASHPSSATTESAFWQPRRVYRAPSVTMLRSAFLESALTASVPLWRFQVDLAPIATPATPV